MSKVSEAAGLLGFDDDSADAAADDEPEGAAPSDGQLAAAEDLGDALKSGEGKKILSAMKQLLDLMD